MQDFNVFQDFIVSLTTEERILLIIAGILILMIGIVLGWILQASKTKRYKKQLLLVTQERDEYERRALTAEELQKTTAKDLERISSEKVAALDELQAARAQVLQLQSRNEDLLNSISQSDGADAGAQPDGESDTGTPPPSGSTQADFMPYLEAIESRFQAFEKRLNELSDENMRLRAASGGEHQVTIGDPLVIRADTTQPGARFGNNGDPEVIVDTTPSLQVPVVEVVDGEYDDLTEIHTIGPFNQRKLNEIGITRYEQIAAWSDEEIDHNAARIGYVAELIRKEDWVGQAKRMVELKSESPESYQRSPMTTTTSDDLKVVEGIGPKIEAILEDAGVNNWQELADTPVEEIRNMLDQAGGNYSRHNPETWPEQARLAAEGKWDELKMWQAELKGGVQE